MPVPTNPAVPSPGSSPGRRIAEVSLRTVNTPAGRVVRRAPPNFITGISTINVLKLTNANAANAAGSTANNIALVLDRRAAGRLIADADLPTALHIPAAAIAAASLEPGRVVLTPGQSLEWLIKPVPSGSHSGVRMNTDPPREDATDHVDYHWDC